MFDLASIAIAAACLLVAFALRLPARPRLMSAAEIFGLALSLAVFAYLCYALFRGEKPVSAISIGQIVFYAVVLIVLGMPLGLYMARVYSAEGGVFTRRFGLGAARARLLPARPHRPGEGAGLEELREDGRHLQRRLLAPPLRAPAAAGPPLPQPGRPAGRAVAHLAEHDRELRHEHELAVLRRRVHDVVPEPDGRARGAELRLGRRRHGRPRRRHPRLHAPLVEDARELLAGPLPVARLHPAPALGRARGRADLAGRAADLRRRRDARRRSRAPSSRSRAGRSPRRSRSSSSGRTAAASTTRTRPSRSRTRTGSRTSSRCSRSCSSRPASSSCSGSWSARGSRATRSSRPCSRCS